MFTKVVITLVLTDSFFIVMNLQLRSPCRSYEKVGELSFLGRSIDKISFKDSELLKPDFIELMGGEFDGRMIDYPSLKYSDFVEFGLSGASDAQCWDYCVLNGRKINDLAVVVRNDYARKRVWSDLGAEVLAKYKSDAQLSDRDDIQTFF